MPEIRRNQPPGANSTLPEPVLRGQEKLIVNQIEFRTADLTPKDIGNWTRAWEAAIATYSPNRARLYDLYTKILNDAHLSGVVSKRIGAVTQCRWVFQRQQKKVDALDTLIRSSAFRELLGMAVHTKLWGQSGLEFIPGSNFAFRHIPRKHIKQKWGIITTQETDITGIPYAQLPNIWIMGKADDIGLLNKCAPMVLYKTGNWGDWAQYIEVFGQPMRIFKYDAYDPQGKKEIQEAAARSGGSMALTIPRQAEFDVKDGKATNGDGKLQDSFRQALNAEMSVCILGNTETTVSSSSSGYAQSQTHGSQQNLIAMEDIADTENMLNDPHFLAILRQFGYDTAGGQFVCLPEQNLDAVKTRIDIIKSLKDMGVPVAHEHIYEITGIPRPETDAGTDQQDTPTDDDAATIETDNVPALNDELNKASVANAWQRLLDRLGKGKK